MHSTLKVPPGAEQHHHLELALLNHLCHLACMETLSTGVQMPEEDALVISNVNTLEKLFIM